MLGISGTLFCGPDDAFHIVKSIVLKHWEKMGELPTGFILFLSTTWVLLQGTL